MDKSQFLKLVRTTLESEQAIHIDPEFAVKVADGVISALRSCCGPNEDRHLQEAESILDSYVNPS